ncbi:MAG: YIP1 family protein [Chloroherpetonaceae bacterium]|nr:YIP1 family protein [Chloroherpetonaceae bacterium]
MLARLLQRIYQLLASPQSEWKRIADEPIYDPQDLIRDYAMPLIVTAVLLEVIVAGVLNGIKTKLVWIALVNVALLSLLLAITTALIQSWAPRFQSSSERNDAAKLAVYGSTPIWLAAMLSALFPLGAFFSFAVKLAGLIYAIYLYSTGLAPVLGTPAAQRGNFSTVLAILLFVIFGIIRLLSGGVERFFSR